MAFTLITLAGQAVADDTAKQRSPGSPAADRPAGRNADRPMTGAKAGVQMFVEGSKMVGMDVENSADEQVGTIDDLIIDRGSGRIRYVVLKSGAVLGMGGKLVTVPYQSLSWDNADKEVLFNATKDEIKQWPEFDKKRWSEGTSKDDSLVRRIGRDYFDTANTPWPSELRSTDSQRVQGTVKNFTRRTADRGAEELYVVVTSPGQPDREVGLGPSWYMAGNNSIAFFRDAPIDVNVVQVDHNGRPITIARSVAINGKEMRFYDEKGRATWTGGDAAADRTAYSASPLVLYSDVKGKPVNCRGDKCGDINEVIVECVSGTAAFVSIDPDENFLGIGDEHRLVPWSIVSASNNDTIYLDANKSMIVGGPAMPKDIKSLNERGMWERVYSGYNVAPSEFRPVR